MDEVGICLGRERVKSVVERGSHCVWIPRGQGGKMRRFATLVVLMSAAGVQPMQLVVILEGKGGGNVRSRAKEWDRSCHVMFQRNAWCDSDTFQAIVDWLPIPAGSLLFLDNLSAHRLAREQICKRHLMAYYGPPNTTDYWQPVDCGLGTPLLLLHLSLGRWLKERVYKGMEDEEENQRVDLLDAPSKRILFLKVAMIACDVFRWLDKRGVR